MTPAPGGPAQDETARPTAPSVLVRYWAGARAAAGVAEERLEVDGPTTLAEVVRRVLAAHPGQRMADVVQVCSVLVGDQPAGRREPGEVVVEPGATVEFLPPFAGG